MSSDEAKVLPEGWVITQLQRIGSWSTGGTPSRKRADFFDGSIAWVKSGDLTDALVSSTEETITEAGLNNSAAKLVPRGSVMIALYGATIGRLGILAMDSATNQACATCTVNEQLSHPWYVLYYLLSQRNAFIEAGQGGAQPNLTNAIVREWPIPIAPLAEQRRIVAKVEALLARVQATRDRLNRVPRLLKCFRQAVLTAACNGQLTADWRDVNPAESDSTAARALDVLSELPEIPETWGCGRAADIVAPGTVISYGIVLPGPNLREGIPYIRGQDIDDYGQIHVEQLWKTSPEIAAKHRRSELSEGDVLLCVIRHLRVAMVPAGLNGANLTQGTVRLRPSPIVYGPFLARYLSGPTAQEWMKQRYIGMAMPRINVSHARDIPVPLPAAGEQQEIVRRVDALFKLAEAIERRVAAATTRADKLTQAILAKAFRGQLVSTEAELARAENRGYESAAELLARLTDAAESPSSKPKRGRRTTARSQ